MVHLEHTYRGANHVADASANLGHSLELGVTFYCIAPSCIVSILVEDSYGVAIPRVV